MSESTETYSKLPARLRDGLERFCADTRAQLQDDLLCVAVYGPPVQDGQFVAGRGPVPVLIVLQDASVPYLLRISATLQRAIQTLGVVPFVLSHSDLQNSTDIFPVKFLQMQEHHLVLDGRDVLSELEISTEHLRLRCEQELYNLLLRQRNALVRTAGDQQPQFAALDRGIEPFFAALSAVVSLTTGLTPGGTVETADAAARILELDRETLQELLDYHHATQTPTARESSEVAEQFIGVLEVAVRYVDGLS